MRKRTLTVIVLILIVAALGGTVGLLQAQRGGFWHSASELPPPPPSPPAFIPPPPITSPPSFTPFPTFTPLPPSPCEYPLPPSDEWATYTTPDGSLSLDYPANWSVAYVSPQASQWGKEDSLVLILNVPKECFPGGMIAPSYVEMDKYLGLRFTMYPGRVRKYGGTAEDYIQQTYKGDPANVVPPQFIRVDGQPGVRDVIKFPEDPKELQGHPGVTFARGDHAYSLVVTSGRPEYRPIFDRVVASIRFLR